MEETRHERFLREIMGSDEEFYEKYLTKLTEEQLRRFLKDNPDFMKE